MTTPAAASLDPIWAWFGARRAGTRYQPQPGDASSADPNGCISKLALLREATFEFAGSRVIGVGCSSGYYETQLCGDALARTQRGARHVTLIDTDQRALDDAEAALVPPGADTVTAFRSAAEHFFWQGRYDLCLFLSLYHHYDRLGAEARYTGDGVLRAIGAHSQAMLFETGQTDDTVGGAHVWRDRIAMRTATSPAAWIEEAIPRLTGYTHWRRLGTNPATQRHLYLFWYGAVAAETQQPRHVRAFHAAGDAAARNAPTMWDGTSSREAGMSDEASLSAAFRQHAGRGDALLLDDLALVRSIGRALPTALWLDATDGAVTQHRLASAAYAGATGYVMADNQPLTQDCRNLAARLGLVPIRLHPTTVG